MQLSAIQVGDVVLVDKRGARFHAHVTAKQRGELRLRPIERNISYTAASAREIVAHWRKSRSSTA
jgi:hypothetical protein